MSMISYAVCVTQLVDDVKRSKELYAPDLNRHYPSFYVDQARGHEQRFR